jgi:hypothetical protein
MTSKFEQAVVDLHKLKCPECNGAGAYREDGGRGRHWECKTCNGTGYKVPVATGNNLPEDVVEINTKKGYPTKLTDYLYDQDMEGAEIFTSPIMDGTLWMIVPKMSTPWVTLITWYDGAKDFDIINLNEKGLDRLVKVLAEVKG